LCVRYYVLSDDGQKYGPADVPTLNQWIAENRLLPTQMLEEEASGARFAARAVPGLNFPMPADNPAPTGPAYSGYYRGPQGAGGAVGGDDGSREITPAWILFAVGVFSGCCLFAFGGFLVPGAGVYFALKAKQKGHPQGGLVFGLNLAVLIVSVLLFILRMVGLALVSNGALPGVPTR
jgi:hypothetical protein